MVLMVGVGVAMQTAAVMADGCDGGGGTCGGSPAGVPMGWDLVRAVMPVPAPATTPSG